MCKFFKHNKAQVVLGAGGWEIMMTKLTEFGPGGGEGITKSRGNHAFILVAICSFPWLRGPKNVHLLSRYQSENNLVKIVLFIYIYVLNSNGKPFVNLMHFFNKYREENLQNSAKCNCSAWSKFKSKA